LGMQQMPPSEQLPLQHP
jgi:hypothetical protein